MPCAADERDAESAEQQPPREPVEDCSVAEHRRGEIKDRGLHPQPVTYHQTRGIDMAGLSVQRVAELKARARRDVDEGLLPACQYALAKHGEVLVHETLGDAPPDARFSIWSTTKPVFSSLVWQLMGEGKLDPLAPVVDLWPEFGAHGKDRVTLEHLLLFTAGFPEGELDCDSIFDRAARVRQMEQWKPSFEPGTAYGYHGFSAHYVMAELVERVTGTDHRTALRERILDPLGLDRLELGVPEDRQGDLQRILGAGEPSTEEEVKDLLGVDSLPLEITEAITAAAGNASVRPDTALITWQRPDLVAFGFPGAGGVSDAASFALFYQHLLHDPKRVWDPAIRHDVTTHVRNTFTAAPFDIIANRTRGLELQGDDPTRLHRVGGGGATPRTFGHNGAAGQISWADPDSGLSFVYLTNGCDRNDARVVRRSRDLNTAALACVA
ncbi:serine hydrolase domain-containing protein [Streptomyces sp. NPDC050121]|uniref:serine hydrolase domain-containing protein n=1 Tax=Streptomyces sp. NPDC050121 TaxID=3365601 RepID=UPI0037B43027